MDSRRDFIRKAALLSGGAGLMNTLPTSIQRALNINPDTGTNWHDAEHVVILMQENRSFDHCYGSLQGVRGFNDPRAILKPDRNSVWLQTNEAGETYAPFRLNIKDTNATWLGSLPHSWTDQVDARNSGRYDKWLLAKASGHEGFEKVPLALGFYNRQDLPFYYSLADAFTICDQNFCSSLTGTTPNRLYLWTGTIREKQDKDSQANVSNSDVDYGREVNWKTFPERLQENNISWKIYQNELSIESGLNEDEDAWLANFTDNPIEWFSQFNVRFSASHFAYLEKMEKVLPGEIKELGAKLASLSGTNDEWEKINDQLKSKQALWERVKNRHQWSAENFDKLNGYQQNLHARAFSTNKKDPHYRELATLHYTDNNTEREMLVPKGDVLHQFREDVNKGELPMVSWVVGSANFSDHPGAPWYGAWYVSEVLDILTQKPELWKKTIFILCYDENDGYFDHVPPFVPPHPGQAGSGKVSAGIDTSVEFVTKEQDLRRTKEKYARESVIGLGYRVPLVIASPWSRGGAVCSQVFDHTSILQFLEKFLNKKTGKKIEETNISAWRRTVCGDLTAVFKPYNGEKIILPAPVVKESFYEDIHKAQFKKNPSGYKKLTAVEITQINKAASRSSRMPRQEKGTRAACALPYELRAHGRLSENKKDFRFEFTAANEIFGDRSAGAPFNVYAHSGKDVLIRNYAVTAGDRLQDEWSLEAFVNKKYHFRINGPNGFFREFRGDAKDPALEIRCEYERKKTDSGKLTGNIIITITNLSPDRSAAVSIKDNSYEKGVWQKNLGKKGSGQEQTKLVIDLSRSFRWYDLSVKLKGGNDYEQRFAGRVETGEEGRTDPAMGNV